MAKKPASPDDIMAVGELKPALRLVKGDDGAEIGCALALTEDKDIAVLVDKKAKPKRVRALLLKRAKEVGVVLAAPSLRFGRATLDPADETVLLIKINKEPAGGQFQQSAKKRLKLAGFKDVVFTVDESLENEEDAAETGDAPPPPPPPPPPPQEDRLPSAEQLRGTMEKLAPNIKAAMAAQPELRAALMSASKAFVALMQASDLSGAKHSLEDLMLLLKQAAQKRAQAGPGGDYPAMRAAWNDALETVESQIEKLAQGLRATDVPALTEIAAFGLNALTGNHKVPLMAALMEVGPGTPESLAKAGPKALEAVRAFKSHIEGDARVAACDANPLGIAVAIRSTLGPALAGLETALSASSKG